MTTKTTSMERRPRARRIIATVAALGLLGGTALIGRSYISDKELSAGPEQPAAPLSELTVLCGQNVPPSRWDEELAIGGAAILKTVDIFGQDLFSVYAERGDAGASLGHSPKEPTRVEPVLPPGDPHILAWTVTYENPHNPHDLHNGTALSVSIATGGEAGPADIQASCVTPPIGSLAQQIG